MPLSPVGNAPHGSENHEDDELHNNAVGAPSYQTKSDVPPLPVGHIVFIESEGALFVEDGT